MNYDVKYEFMNISRIFYDISNIMFIEISLEVFWNIDLR